MFEDVFEPLDDIIGDAKEVSDEWGEVWDTGEKEDMWRTDPKDVWSVAPAIQPDSAPDPAPNQPKSDPMNNNTPVVPDDDSNETAADKGSGLFDDLFLDIF